LGRNKVHSQIAQAASFNGLAAALGQMICKTMNCKTMTCP
jgi:hypothetical protein